MTEEQELKEFWEAYGFEETLVSELREEYVRRQVSTISLKPIVKIKYPDGNIFYQYPPLTLDNLFKYAVSKFPYVVLENCQSGYIATASYDMKTQSKIIDKDPAQALYQALNKVRRGE